PLADIALKTVQRQPRGGGPYVFSADGQGHNAYVATSLTDGLRKWFKARPDVQPHTAHDLRRTARTIMAAREVPDNVAEMALGHAVGSQDARTYNVHDYKVELRKALDAINDHVQAVMLS